MTKVSSEPECPGPDCRACNGEACETCRAGLTIEPERPKCEHDVIERHGYVYLDNDDAFASWATDMMRMTARRR